MIFTGNQKVYITAVYFDSEQKIKSKNNNSSNVKFNLL